MAKSKDFWKKRFEKLEDDTYRKSQAYYQDLQKQFRRTSNEIEMQISSWYYRLADNNEISYSLAKKYLNRKELKEFRWTVKQYIEYGKDNALNQKWMKEFENASIRVHISRLEAMKLQMQQQIERLFVEYEGGTRTSKHCRHMDGKHFPLSDYKVNVTAPPFHCRCRTCTCPYLDGV